MKKICIALDYSPSAQKVAEIGYRYAKALGAKVTLLHIIVNPEYYGIEYAPIMGHPGFFNNSRAQMSKSIKEQAESFLTAVMNHLGNHAIKTKVLEGETANAILEYTSKSKIDLLVMGTHSHSGLENILIGNTAVKVVKNSKIPMLIIPSREK